MDLAALTDFNLVAAHGGFGRASRASGRPKATLSRRIMELEQSLGVRLLERGARSLRLTEEGALLYAWTEGLLSEIGEVGAVISAGLSQMRGRLRISAPTLFAHVALGRITAGFLAAYPEMRVEVTAEDRMVDLVEEGYDLTIRTNPRPTEELVGRCFARDQMLVVAPVSLSPPRDDGSHTPTPVPAIVSTMAPQAPVWTATDGSDSRTYEADPVLRLSSILMIRDAVRAGAGAALLPRSLVSDDLATGRLACWGEVSGPAVELWVLHTSRRLANSKVRAFIQFLCDAYPTGLFE